MDQATEQVAITVITRIEILQGRFASVLKAENGETLFLAQQRLTENERDLESFLILPIERASIVELDRLRQEKKLKKIGRSDPPHRQYSAGQPCHVGYPKSETLSPNTRAANRVLG